MGNMDSKAWYLSTKIWIGIIGVIGGLSATLAGPEGMTIPGIVGAVLSALVIILRIIEGKDTGSTEQPISGGFPIGNATTGLLAGALVAGMVIACNPFVVRTTCPVGVEARATIDPGDGLKPGKVVHTYCGDELQAEIECSEARLVCTAEPFIECKTADGGEARIIIEDPDGVSCGN